MTSRSFDTHPSPEIPSCHQPTVSGSRIIIENKNKNVLTFPLGKYQNTPENGAMKIDRITVR